MEVAVTPARSTIAVTGAGGFIGRAVVPALLAAGYDVCALVRAVPPAVAETAPPRRVGAREPGPAIGSLQWRPIGNLVDADDAALREALAGAATVVHLAAQAHRPSGKSPAALAALHAVNADLPARLASAAATAGVRHFVFASSVKVHGETSPADRALREGDPLVPADPYGASKVAAEAALARVAATTALRVTALRLPLVYGPGAKANFAALVRAVRRGALLPVGSLANRRSLLATGNLASALLALLHADEVVGGGEAGTTRFTPYFVADAEAVSTPDLVRALAAALGVAPRIVPCPPRLLGVATHLPVIGERIARLVTSLAVDTTAFRTRFGWTPPLSLAAGLAAAVDEVRPR
ncbi:MAG: NAD-dependent epimerase/dehydratase family protein [Burkholderiales bacterium]|nr:NAD-dependent epimerase/dehydratase family protein [Burkholderiales bacterium]